MFAIQLDERNVRDTVKLFYSLGFIALPEKSSFVPQHRVTFVGFIIDSTTMTVYPTSEKIEKMIHICQGLLECPHALQSMRGGINPWVAHVTFSSSKARALAF